MALLTKRTSTCVRSKKTQYDLLISDQKYNENNDIPTLGYIPVPKGTEHDEKVFSFCYKRAHTAHEIAEYLGLSDSSFLRKQILGNLEENEYLEKNKVSRTYFYKTNQTVVVVE